MANNEKDQVTSKEQLQKNEGVTDTSNFTDNPSEIIQHQGTVAIADTKPIQVKKKKKKGGKSSKSETSSKIIKDLSKAVPAEEAYKHTAALECANCFNPLTMTTELHIKKLDDDQYEGVPMMSDGETPLLRSFGVGTDELSGILCDGCDALDQKQRELYKTSGVTLKLVHGLDRHGNPVNAKMRDIKLARDFGTVK